MLPARHSTIDKEVTMTKRKRILWGVLVTVVALLTLRPASHVEAMGGSGSSMIWMTTSNWLNCDQTGPTPECADYGTPTGSTVQMTCCVPRSALGTSDMSACSGDGGQGRDRIEL